MSSETTSAVMIAAGSRSADFNGEFVGIDPFAENAEITVDLTAIARTTTGTLQVLIDVSYDDGVTWEAPQIISGAANTAAVKDRYFFDWKPPASTATLADSANFQQQGIASAPSAGNFRRHPKPDGYRARADMAGDTTSYNVAVTLRQTITA